jgi:hypothetical protein
MVPYIHIFYTAAAAAENKFGFFLGAKMMYTFFTKSAVGEKIFLGGQNGAIPRIQAPPLVTKKFLLVKTTVRGGGGG